VTLLRANGHPEAGRYPMGRVLLETWLIRRMQHKQLASAASVFNMTVTAMLAGKDQEGDQARRAFRKFVSEA
jgi:hypothetical protein